MKTTKMKGRSIAWKRKSLLGNHTVVHPVITCSPYLKGNSGVTTEENVKACKKDGEAHIPLSVRIIFGLGGNDSPESTPISEQLKAGEFVPMQLMVVLNELKIFIKNLELSNCTFRTNHAPNCLSIGGTFPKDRAGMLTLLAKTLRYFMALERFENFRYSLIKSSLSYEEQNRQCNVGSCKSES